MRVVDARGRLFGAVNVVDALVVLVVLAAAVSGGALVLSTGAQAEDSQSTNVVVRTTVAPYVHEAVQNGSPTATDIQSVDAVSEIKRIEANASQQVSRNAETLVRIDVRLTVTARIGDDGLPYFRDDRLYVGRELRLDFGTTIIEGVVVDVPGR